MDISKLFLKLERRHIELDVIINCILVHQNIRNSFILEEYNNNYSQTVTTLKKTLKKLKFVEVVSISLVQGTLITNKNTILKSEPLNLADMTRKEIGILLSYPCAGDDHTRANYFFNMTVNYKDTEKYLISMTCAKKNTRKMKKFIDRITKCIKSINDNIANPIKSKFNYIKNYSIQDAIKLVALNKLNERNIYSIINLFRNFLFEIIYVLHKESVFDIYNKKFNFLMIYLLNLCKIDEEYGLTPYENPTLAQTVESISFNLYKRTHLVVNLFNDLFDIRVKQQYITEAIDINI